MVYTRLNRSVVAVYTRLNQSVVVVYTRLSRSVVVVYTQHSWSVVVVYTQVIDVYWLFILQSINTYLVYGPFCVSCPITRNALSAFSVLLTKHNYFFFILINTMLMSKCRILMHKSKEKLFHVLQVLEAFS